MTANADGRTDYIETIKTGLRHFGINEHGNSAADKLLSLAEYVLEINKTHNLTAIRDLPDFIVRHLFDSMSIIKHIGSGENISLADVGSGAGFPGLVAAILREDITVTLIESSEKKSRFLRNAARTLSIPNVSVANERAEVLGNDPDYREKFDYVTARGVAKLDVLCELCLPLVKPGGSFIAMKSDDYEIKQAEKICKDCGGELHKAVEFALPLSDIRHCLIIINKTKRTPDIYPRSYAKIKNGSR